jgi:NADPH:quinone reductase-like Zn-dependent oxidoreductase
MAVEKRGHGVKAASYTRYGPPDILQIVEVAPPVPGDDDVLIAVRAASANPLDVHFMRGRPWPVRLAMGLRRPKRTRPGVDLAGIVEAIGRNVTQFRPGDAVFGSCRGGAFAELVCAAEDKLAAKPASLSFEQAAALPVAGLTALQGLRDKGRLQPGQRVLINGAGGGIGTLAVQIAKALGAEVTAVCGADKLSLVRGLGAGRAIDYRKEDFLWSGERFDLVFDAVGNLWFPACRRALTPSGIVVAAGGGGPGPPRLGRLAARLLTGLLWSLFGHRKLVVLMAKLRAEDLTSLAALVDSGRLMPVLDVRHGLEALPDALRQIQGGHARGKLVISLTPPE